VLLPVKAFAAAKRRLSPALGPEARAELARAMAEAVVEAAWPLTVAVVCDSADVARWAEGVGALVVHAPGLGLDGAVAAGVAELEDAGATEVIVAHADLPAARRLADLAGFAGITLVPDRRRDGTNVVVVPRGARFCFRYGPRSFSRHQLAARRSGLPWRVVHDDRLAWDIDVPDDLPDGSASLRDPGRLADHLVASIGRR